MRKGTLSLTTTTLIAGAFLTTTPVLATTHTQSASTTDVSPRTLACTTYKRLIANGDLTGLRALTGTK